MQTGKRKKLKKIKFNTIFAQKEYKGLKAESNQDISQNNLKNNNINTKKKIININNLIYKIYSNSNSLFSKK